MQLLGLAGSIRAGSLNRQLLVAAEAELTELLPAAAWSAWEGLAWLPPYSEDDDGPTAPFVAKALRQALGDADGVLIATPEYNASIPGALKNALDWASRPWPHHGLEGKPVAVIGASPSAYGAALAQAEVRKVLDAMGARVVGGELCVAHADQAFDDDGRLRDASLRRQLAELVSELVTAAEAVDRDRERSA